MVTDSSPAEQALALLHWQTSGGHPLTCGKDSRHAPLYAVLCPSGIELRCHDCDYVQPHWPVELIVESYRNR